jgi:alpha-amylase
LETTHTGTQTYTDFTGVASGKFQEQVPIFYKTHTQNNDEGVLEVPRLSPCSSNVQVGFGYDLMA